MVDVDFLSCLEDLPEATPSEEANVEVLDPLDKLQGEFNMVKEDLVNVVQCIVISY